MRRAWCVPLGAGSLTLACGVAFSHYANEGQVGLALATAALVAVGTLALGLAVEGRA